MTDLQEIARQVRVLTLKSIANCGSGHPGGSLSCTEILVYLHAEVMTEDDIFVLSKGHAAPCYYSVLAILGQADPAQVMTLRQLDSPFQGHPSLPHLPQVQASSGSLGVAYATAVGMALGRKLTGQPGRVFVLVGDGEIQEGIVAEASRAAAHYGLNNLCVVVDWNGKMSDQYSIFFTELFSEFSAWGFYQDGIDGHSFEELSEAFQRAKESEYFPYAILANTIKGRGVSFFEQDPSGGHGSMTLSDEDLERSLKELEP